MSMKVVLHFFRGTLLLKQSDKPDSSGIEPGKGGGVASTVGFYCREIMPLDNQPDMDLANGINGLTDNCRECRVSTGEESAGEIVAVDSADLCVQDTQKTGLD
jgi:hypothetical protein